ncbi:MAG: hypothetical protein ACPGH0_00930 [Opitutales bacterium]
MSFFWTIIALIFTTSLAQAHSTGGHHEGIAANTVHFLTELSHFGPALLIASLLLIAGFARRRFWKSKRSN